jgi:pullulanase
MALLGGCKIEHVAENAATPAPAASAAGSPAMEAAAKGDVLTIHYHRADGNYTGAGLWTWDGYQKHTPARNELMPVGQDEFGVVFQLDRGRYGESDKIGLLPRMSRDWTRKDGTDRIWTPALGKEVWIFSGMASVLGRKPDPAEYPERVYADEAKYDTAAYDSPEAVLGASYSPAGTVFRVFAPGAHSVSVVLYENAAGNEGRVAVPMHATPKGIWEALVTGDLAGRFYMLLAEGPGLAGRETLDPYATNTVSSSTRARITPPTPAPPPLARRPEAPEDRIVYEMHVRDFTIAANSGSTAPGLYLGWTQGNTRLAGDAQIKTGVDHLAELGITDVQIMPVQDFANDEAARAYNWGYVTTAFFSPEGMYATNPADDSRVHELKGLIAALHERGIGVIMDVVYNHTSDTAPFGEIVSNYYYRRLADGTPANGSGCGNEFRTEAPMGRKYILDSLKYWVREYGVDGFRFDLMALIDRETMREVESELHAMNPAIAIYGEPWMANDSPLAARTDKTALTELPVGAFNDDFRNALKGLPDGTAPGFIQDGSNREALEKAMMVSDWLGGPGQSINYMTCHDNLVLWDKLKVSMPGAADELIKKTVKLGYLVLLTSQGVPFMQGGEEFGRSKGGDDNSYQAPDAVNEVDWSLKERNYDLFRYVRDLIAMRKGHPLFRLRTREEIARRVKFLPTESGLAYEIDGSGVRGETWSEALVLVNPDNVNGLAFTLPDGQWEAACDENGATMGRTMSGRITVPAKTGLVVFQQ